MPTASIGSCHRFACASIVALAAALAGAHPVAASPQAPLPPGAGAAAQAPAAQAAASGQAAAPAQPPSVPLPDSRPGRLMAEWLALCDKPEFQVTRVEVDEGSDLAVFAVGRLSHARWRLTLALDADGRIAPPQPAAPAATAPAAAPVDVTGSWSGTAVLESASGSTRLVQVEAEFRAEGSRVSGSVTLSPPPGPSAPGLLTLTSGAVAGNRLTFSAERNVVVYLFDLAIVSAACMEGSVTSESHGEEQSTGRITFIRSRK